MGVGGGEGAEPIIDTLMTAQRERGKREEEGGRDGKQTWEQVGVFSVQANNSVPR